MTFFRAASASRFSRALLAAVLALLAQPAVAHAFLDHAAPRVGETVHGALAVFGQFVYLGAVAHEHEPSPAFARTVTLGAAAIALTLVLWLGLEAISMSGLPLGEALGAGTLAVVATQTIFGRVWLLRLAL